MLLWLLAVAQGAEPRPQHDLASYLGVAAAYGSASPTALQEIRQWTPPDVTSAVSDLQRKEDRLRAVPTSPDDIDGLRDGEQSALLAFREEVHLLQPFTPERDLVRRALDEASPRGSTALCHAVYAALRLREPGPRRTAVVVFSDGIDNVSWLTASEVVEAASRSEAIVYGVAVRENGERRDPFLRDVVRATGGQFFEAASERDLRSRFLDVLSDIRSRYVLSYAPAGVNTAAGWHSLEVRLKRVKADVLARPGYWRSPAP